MKKFSIWFNILLCIPLCILLFFFVLQLVNLSSAVSTYQFYLSDSTDRSELLIIYRHIITLDAVQAGLFLIGFLANLTVLILYNCKTFRQSMIEKHEKRKAERLAARQAKAEENKRKHIAELETKLDELKKGG